MTEQTGTFVVTHADDDDAVLQHVETAQILPLSSNPALEVNDVLEATVAPEPPLEVTWQVLEVADQRTVELLESDLSPTTQTKAIATALPEGEFERIERAGRGEIHVFRVPSDHVEAAVSDVLEDDETVARAARLEAVRVEVRRSVDDGVVSVRYLPD